MIAQENAAAIPPRDRKGRFLKGHIYNPKGTFKRGESWRSPKPHWNREWLWNEYIIRFRSAKEIADGMECTENNILYWLEKHKIPIRTTSEIRAAKHWGLSGSDNPMYGKCGPDHPNWKGGVTPARQTLYRSNAWDQASRKCRRRANYQCQECGTPDIRGKNKSHIHHIRPFGDAPELGACPDNLALLCVPCHHWVHNPNNIERRWLA